MFNIGLTLSLVAGIAITIISAQRALFIRDEVTKGYVVVGDNIKDMTDDVDSSCSSRWKEFSDGRLLTETHINKQPSIWDQNFCQQRTNNGTAVKGTRCHRDYWKGSGGGLFIHPPSRFAFCIIAKNGCSQWTNVLNKLHHNNTNKNGAAYGIAGNSVNTYGVEGIERIFADPGATKAVMVRDPLARFTSAYLNKCFAANCTNPFCYARKHAGKKKGQKVTFREAINWILDQDVSSINGHWKLQSEHCNLRNHIKDYTIIGRMEKETLSSDASCLMDKAGISMFNKVNDSSPEPFWRDKKDMVSKKHHSTKQELVRVESEEDVLKKLFTPRMARILVEKMQQDYDTFKLPEPTWIKDATGEWLDSNEHHVCK